MTSILFTLVSNLLRPTLLLRPYFLLRPPSRCFTTITSLTNCPQNAQILTGGEKCETPGVPSGGCHTPKLHPLSTIMVPEKIVRWKSQKLSFLDRFVFGGWRPQFWNRGYGCNAPPTAYLSGVPHTTPSNTSKELKFQLSPGLTWAALFVSAKPNKVHKSEHPARYRP